MTFEQWAAEMRKGLSLRRDENPKSPNRYDSIPSWNDDRFGREFEEEDLSLNPSQKSPR